MTLFSRRFPLILETFTILLYSSFLWICKTADSLPNYNLRCTTLDPIKTGFTITGNLAGDYFGYPGSNAGDIDNDGYADIIIGAFQKGSNQGAAYVIYGGPTSSFSNLDLSSTTLDPKTSGFTMIGNAVGDKFGLRVATAGDINNDGYDDIIIGAPFKTQTQIYKGAVYVIYGGPRSSMLNRDFSVSTTTLDPATTGFMMIGNGAYAYFGYAVSSAGDVNKDGYNDILIGAYGKNTAYVIYGGPKSSMMNRDFSLSTTTLDPASTGFMITGGGVYFGRSVSPAQDLNKDGYDDILIGDFGLNSNQGAVYAIYGREKSSMSNLNLGTSTLDPVTTGFMITGNLAADYFGYTISTGDINKDGYIDILIGASQAFSTKGSVTVIYGREKSLLSNIALSSTTLIPSSTGFIITGNAVGDYIGGYLGTMGDINRDGYDDIVVGGYGNSGSTGVAYLIYGGHTGTLSHIDLSSQTLDPATTGFTITGNTAGDYLGVSISMAGDINNDGYQDIIIGAYGKSSFRGIAYVIHNACLAANCDSCISRSVCEKCTTPYLLYDSWCLPACPKRTYSSSMSCKHCPVHCSSCTSQESCQTCDQGYNLLDSLCASPSSLHTEGSSLQTISSVTKGMGSVVSIGGSIFPLTALVSKIVQNTRYINLAVTEELAEIYQTWDTDLISWDVPNLVSRYDHFETAPTLFARYELDSSFLVNFWSTLMTIAVGFATFIAIFLLKKLLEQSEYNRHWVYSLLLKLLAGSFNFALIQIYICLDDILFYLVLDAKTNPFNTFFCWMSLFFAIGFLALGCFLIWLNLKTVKQYQALKEDKAALEAFNENNKYWQLFYSDFNDENFWSQSGLAIFLVRSTLSSLIIAVLYEYPVMQTVYLIIIDGVILLFLYFEKPFATFQSTLCQYFYEIITLLVHICTCILSMQNSSDGLKTFLSNSIIYLNTALVTGSIGFMFLEIYKTIRRKIKTRKQYEEIAIQTISNKDLDLQNTTHLETDPENIEQVAPLENLHLLSGLAQQDSKTSLPGLNLQSSNNFNPDINTDGPLISDIDSNSRIHQQQNYADQEIDLIKTKIFHKSSIPQETLYM